MFHITLKEASGLNNGMNAIKLWDTCKVQHLTSCQMIKNMLPSTTDAHLKLFHKQSVAKVFDCVALLEILLFHVLPWGHNL